MRFEHKKDLNLAKNEKLKRTYGKFLYNFFPLFLLIDTL